MILLANDAVGLTRKELGDLLEYSTSLPTGTTPGKVWKRRIPPWAPKNASGVWWRGVFGKPYPEGHPHHGQVPIGWRRIVVLGQEPTAYGITVGTPAMRGRMVDAPVGMDEGELCLRSYDGKTCLGVVEYRPDDNLGSCSCSTMRMPPCSYCISTEPECPVCAWRIDE